MQGIHFVFAAAVGFWCATSSGDVTISGRVTDLEGNPVSRAQVFWLRPAPINSYPESIDGTANDEGLFELRLPGLESPAEVERETVLIYAEGHGLGVTTVGRLRSSSGREKVAVSLPVESNTAFRVVDSKGHDLAGELVEPVIYVTESSAKLPVSFVQAIGRVTSPAGIVEFPALTNKQLKSVQVVSQRYGTQQLDRRWVNDVADQTITVREPGRVEVRFDTTGGLSMRNCKMLAFTAPTAAVGGFPGIPGGSIQGAFAEFFNDNRGFDIPTMAEGTLRFQLSGCRNDEPALPHWPEKTELKAGATEKFVIPFEKTVTVRGRVIDRATDKPCANVQVFVYTRYAGCSILTHTDDEGHYSCNVLKGPACVSAHRLDLVKRVSSGSSSLIERVVEAEGLEFPDLILAPQSVATK